MSPVQTPNPTSMTSPIYHPFAKSPTIGAAYTGKGTSPQNGQFTFHRPSPSNLPGTSEIFTKNIQHLAQSEGFDASRLTLPNGAWPHSGTVLVAEACRWIPDLRTGCSVPTTRDGQQLTYDGIVTRSSAHVLAVQGADCPSLFLCDVEARVIGLAHAGWKPVVRGVVRRTVEAMERLGAAPRAVMAFVAPGVGDRFNEFRWDGEMEDGVRSVFVEAGREELLQDRTLRHEMNEGEKIELRAALGRRLGGEASLKLSSLVVRELEGCGLLAENVSWSEDSSIVDRYEEAGEETPFFKYHSYRREWPDHGLSISVLFLTPETVE